ncbi:MAG: uroporphyrinogen decarboxylase [Bacteroidetes bacterium]|nr:uroporphyrinogen decarboxylase [Bacteroidota bacterium]
MSYQNDLLLRVARGEQGERTPVWMMRQAGRILPQYREVRASLSGFVEMVRTPEYACEVTIQPVDELDVDAAIIFSDILVIPEALGLAYKMIEDKGPFFEKVITSAEDVAQLREVNPEEHLGYVLDAIKLTKQELKNRVPLIGFAGAPWTIFSYMIEGQGSKSFSKAKKFLFSEGETAHQLLQKITRATIAYLKAQITAGVDIVQVFDSWAGVLSPDSYSTYSLPYIKQICDAINDVPVIVFAKGAYFARRQLGQLDCQVIGLDWNMDVWESRDLIGADKVLQGNLDPCLLYADMDTIKKETTNMLNLFGPGKHIANLGHGVYPDTELDKVKCFIDTVKEHKFS